MVRPAAGTLKHWFTFPVLRVDFGEKDSRAPVCSEKLGQAEQTRGKACRLVLLATFETQQENEQLYGHIQGTP